MDEFFLKCEARFALKNLQESLRGLDGISNEQITEFHGILTRLQSLGFHMRPFFLPVLSPTRPMNADLLRVHIIACIHHLKKVHPKAA